MEIFDNKDDTITQVTDDWTFEKLNKFKYLGVILITNND